MMTCWDDHLAERCVPALLPHLLAHSGFRLEGLKTVTLTDQVLKPDGLAFVMMQLMTAFARDRGEIPESEITAWAAEQEDLARAGRFFFSLTQFITIASKQVQ